MIVVVNGALRDANVPPESKNLSGTQGYLFIILNFN